MHHETGPALTGWFSEHLFSSPSPALWTPCLTWLLHCLNSVMTLSPERSPKRCCFRDTCSAESDSPLGLHQLGPRSPSSGPSGSWLSTRPHSLSNTQHTVQKMVEPSRLFTNRSAHQSPGRLGHLPGPLTHGLIQDADRVWHQEHLHF